MNHQTLLETSQLTDIIALAQADLFSELNEVNDQAQQLIDCLEHASPEEMTAIYGVGPKMAQVLHAGIRIGRLASVKKTPTVDVTSPADAAKTVKEVLVRLDRPNQACLFVLLMTVKNTLMGTHLVSIGTLTSAPVEPRDVFRPCIRKGCAAVILAHNHPSGDPTPSDKDRRITDRLVMAGRLLGIKILDHIVTGGDQYVSFRENKLFNRPSS